MKFRSILPHASGSELFKATHPVNLLCPSNHTRYVDFWPGPCNGPFVHDLARYSDLSMGLSMDGVKFCVFLVVRKSFNVNPQEPRHVSSAPQATT